MKGPGQARSGFFYSKLIATVLVPAFGLAYVLDGATPLRVFIAATIVVSLIATGFLLGRLVVQPVATLALVPDVTERESGEKELTRRNEEFRAVVENAPDAISRFDRDLRYVYVNPAIEQMTGIPVSQFAGKRHHDLGMPPELCRTFERALTEVFATGEERMTEFTYPSPAGDRILQGRIVPEFNEKHEVDFALSVTRDITAIRRSEAQLARAQRIANIGSWEMNLENGALTWSDELFKIAGFVRGAPPSFDAVLARVPADDRQRLLDAQDAAVRDGETQKVEHRMTVSRDERILSVLLEPQKNAAGIVVKLAGTVQDVTVLRQTETSLRQSEQRMRNLIDSANDSILTLDTTGSVLEVNPATERLMGERAESLIGRHITQAIHPDHVAGISRDLATVIESGSVAHIEATVRRATGDYVDIEATASRNGSDSIFVIGRDVTERRRADAERRELTRKIELLLESTYEGIYSSDLEGRCTLVNRAAATMFGYSPSEILGQNLHALIHHHRANGALYPAADCPLTRVIDERKPSRITGEVFWRRDGTSFPVEMFVSPILDENDAVLGAVVSFIDVTERQFLQTELERANRLTGLGRVAASMSHEFNNVLMGIQPFAEVLMRSSQDQKVIHAAKRISQSVQRGRRVTEELRGFTRQNLPLRRPVDVQAYLTECTPELRKILPWNIQLNVESGETPMTIDADREQITQVVTNIIINAVDAIGRDSGALTLAVTPVPAGEKFPFGTLPHDRPFIHFSITDDGPGITAENLARVVEPFFTTKTNGTGLGLAMTHQIITQHAGYLFIESKVDVGTVVHFFIPAAAQREEAMDTKPAAPAKTSTLPSEIMLIEDDEDVASGLSVLLNEEGLKITIAPSGADAMRLLETIRPEALVIDIGLPDCDGFSLYQRITAKFGRIPAVFSSGHADPGRIAGLGPEVRLLTKPYEVAMLLEALEAVTRNSPT